MENQGQYSILRPPPGCFLTPIKDTTEEVLSQGGAAGVDVPVLEKVHLEPEGGMYLYYKGVPYPKKGFPYPEAIAAVNKVKNTFMLVTLFADKILIPAIIGLLFFTSFKQKIKWLEKVLFQFCKQADWELTPHYLQEKYYGNCPREIWKFIFNFLKDLGISAKCADPLCVTPTCNHSIAYRTGRVIATLLEYDDAYTYRIGDLFSTTSKEKLLANPRKEIKLIIQTLEYRQPNEFHVGSTGWKFRMFGRLASALLLIPKIKKTFKSALLQSDFIKFQLDEADKYWCLMRNDYMFFGESPQIRNQKWQEIHKGKNPEMVNVSLKFNN